MSNSCATWGEQGVADVLAQATRLVHSAARLGLAVHRSCRGDPGRADAKAARVADLAHRFTAPVRGCGVTRGDLHPASGQNLDAWLAEARACGVRAIETFAAGLEQDRAAVRAALTTPWSNGQAEGQITQLKMLKRTMYGRAGLDLLRRRVLLAT